MGNKSCSGRNVSFTYRSFFNEYSIFKFLFSKDIVLPETLQRSLAIEAEELRGARAKIISAEGELDASVAMKEASDTMAQNHLTLQVNDLHV